MTIIRTRMTMGQLDLMIGNLEANNRALEVDSTFNIGSTELHVFKKLGDPTNAWVSLMNRARKLGFEVTPHIRFSDYATSRDDWFNRHWWEARAIELQKINPEKQISLDHESYGSFGQITGSEDEYVLFKSAMQPWLNVVRRNKISVHVIPAISTYFMCRALFESGSEISGTAHVYIHGLSLSFWTDEADYIVRKTYLERVAWHLSQSLPNATVGVVIFDGVLSRPFYERREYFTTRSAPIMTDDEIFKSDSDIWGTSDFENFNIENFQTPGTLGHQGLVNCYQRGGVKDRTQRYDNHNGPQETDVVADRLPSMALNPLDVTYLSLHSPPSPWQIALGRQPNGSPGRFDFPLQAPFQVTLHAQAVDWTNIRALSGVWLEDDQSFQSWRLTYDHSAGKIIGEVRNTSGQTFSVELNKTLMVDTPYVFRMYVSENASMYVAVDNNKTDGTYSGQLTSVNMFWTADRHLDIIELQFWNRSSDNLERYPFFNPALLGKFRLRYSRSWPQEGNTKP